MKQNYSLKLKTLAALCLAGSGLSYGQTTYNYTGSMETYTVPVGVTSVKIECWGAQGESVGSSTAGLGGYVSGELSVVPGQELYIFVGGQDGFNGGGADGSGSGYLAGNGGGASDVRTGGMTYADRLIVAGGGGGAGKSVCTTQTGGDGGWPGGTGGWGDGVQGGNGTALGGGSCSGSGGCDQCCSSSRGGGGGGQDGGGAQGGYGAATGGTGGACGGDNTDYSGGCGNAAGGGGCFGDGGDGSGLACNGGGGGGGGGWYGGGSGGGNWGSGGGGGSSYFGGAFTATAFTNGTNTGNGKIVITELCSVLVTSVSADSVCDGEMVTLHAESTNGGSISWTGGITDNTAFTPAIGTTTYTATSTDSQDCGFAVAIFVGAIPTVDAGLDVMACPGDSVLLHGMGTATDWTWDNGITDSVWFNPSVGTTTYTVTGTIDSTGCQATDQVDVTSVIIDISVTVSGADLSANQAGATYQWVDCSDTSAIAGATGQSFTPTSDGDYMVIVTLNGCEDTSACQTIFGLGVDEVPQAKLAIYPNPTSETFTIELTGKFTYVVTDAAGRIILSGQGENKKLLSLEDQENGVYFVGVTANGETQTISLIKK